MKSILIKTVPYIITFLVINFICYKTSSYFKQERKYVDRIETAIASKPEIVFLGDSHVESIKNVDLPKNIGNLAFGGDGINEMYIKVLTMIKYNENLEYVFIATEPQIFNNSLSSNSVFLNEYILTVDDTLNVYNKSKLELVSEKIPLFNDSYLKFIRINIYRSINPDKKSSGKDWHKLTDAERTEIAIKTGKLDHGSIMTNKEYQETYKAMVNICKSNNIKVVGVRFPVNENYINQCSEEDILKVNNFVDSLNLDYNLDYSTVITDPNLFHDEDHLNKKGIEKLSEFILRDTNIKLIE